MGFLDKLLGREKKDNELEEFMEQFKWETLKEAVYINTIPGRPELTDSKFGGVPYIPPEGRAPENTLGQQFTLLAQINLEDLPPHTLPLPGQGLLQFFVLDDGKAGLDTGNLLNRDKHRVIYYPNIDFSVSALDVLDKYRPYVDFDFWMPFENNEFRLAFNQGSDPKSITDWDFEEKFVSRWNELHPERQINEPEEIDEKNRICDVFSTGGHKIGGYPDFCQWDPRDDEYKDYDVLLLQMSSEINSVAEIMWADMGSAQFMIKKSELEDLNFDNVLYSWDC